eukprot:scaffold49246_cov37-Cyclotella_meneghiniana.AAC.2
MIAQAAKLGKHDKISSSSSAMAGVQTSISRTNHRFLIDFSDAKIESNTKWYLWRTKDQIVVYPGHCKIYANNQVATELKSKAQSFCGIHNTKWLHPMIKKKGEKFVLLWMGHSILLPSVIISID